MHQITIVPFQEARIFLCLPLLSIVFTCDSTQSAHLDLIPCNVLFTSVPCHIRLMRMNNV